MLQSVVFSDNTYWAFEYDAADPNNTSSFALADLLKVTLPTGGSISYAWSGISGADMTNRAVVTRTVDASDGTGAKTWQYIYSGYSTVNGNTTLYTTVQDPLGNQTVHTMTGLGGKPGLYETAIQYYQGSQASGTLLETVQTDYQFTANPWDSVILSGGSAAGAKSVTSVFPDRVTTTLPNGLVKKQETDYDTALAYHGPLDGITYNTESCYMDNGTQVCSWSSPVTNPVTNYTGSYGKVIATREYDWGQGTPGPLLRQASTQYQWQINGNYLSNNFLDLVSSSTTKDGAGNQVAQTTYGYDEYGLGSSGAAQLNTSPSNGSFRGNQTSAHHWLNGSTVSTANCPISLSNGFLVSYAQYNDSGTVASTTDPCGTSAGDSHHTTTHTYGSAYAGAYPTQTCNPLGQCVSGAYDFNTGLLTSFTDANNQITTYSFDNRWRITQALFPVADTSGVHPETDFDYPNVTTVHRKRKQSPAPTWIEDYAYFDGVGRTKQTRLVDQEGDDFVDTTYDALGRVSTVSNPHRSTASSTDGITTTYYDALSRVVQVAGQDGTLVPGGTAVTQCQANNSCTDYSNFPTVTVSDQAGNSRRSRTDALGRLVEVDEPSPGGTQPGTPGSGSVMVSGSLYSSTSSGTKAAGSFTIQGGEGSVTYPGACYPVGCFYQCDPPQTVYDSGNVSVTVNGFTSSYTYQQGDTTNSVAAGLAGGFNVSGSPVTATLSGSTVYLTAIQPGPNYSMSQVAVTSDASDFSGPSFWSSLSGSTLTGGVYPVTTYDSGTVTVTVDGFQASVPYNQNQNNTAPALTQALVSSLNASGSPVTASLSGSTGIQLTAKSVGTATNYAVAGSSTISFTASSTTLSGGTNPSGMDAPYQTLYSYDALGNLTQVNQLGDGSQSRVRRFTYDSLSRLLTANNPESGQISYGYDADGNLTQKNSPAPNVISPSTGTQTISYCYDVLNRILGKGYGSQSCPLTSPAVGFTYDQGGAAVNAIGHLTYVADQAGSATYTYDALGRTATESRTTAGIVKNMSYAYNLDSSLQGVTYPSGAVVGYQYTNSGRVGLAQDQGHSINYVTGAGGPSTLATHFPDGSLSAYINGYTGGFAGITNSFTYNKRLQPINMSASSPAGTVFSLNYDFHVGAGNNGNVFGITNNKDNSRDQSFAYDSLNRLTSAHNAGTNCSAMTLNGKTEYWGNSYSYDPFGNLTDKTKTQCGGEDIHFNTDAQNRIHPKSGADYAYDIAGNMTYDASMGLNYSYDQENRITGAGGFAYTYDADGNRVKKSNGSTGTLYWYMSPGIVAESDLSGNLTSEYVFFNGERVARRDNPSGSGGVFYYFSDHLKTTDIVTNAQGTILNESDYYPWGGELQFSNADSNHYKFTGKERDTETGLDYFGARYYSNGLGRFITPDWADKATAVPYAEFADPQSLNLYTYVRNVPTTRFDADGHWPQTAPLIFQADQEIRNNPGQAWRDVKQSTVSFLQSLVNLLPFGDNKPHPNYHPPSQQDPPATSAVGRLTTAGLILTTAALPMPKGGAVVDMTAAARAPATIETATVMHFTSDAGVAGITDSGGVLRSGTYVTTSGEIPSGATSSQVESLLEIGAGKGQNSVTFETPTSNLTVPENGPTTSGGAQQFQLKEPTQVDTTKFKKTDGGS